MKNKFTEDDVIKLFKKIDILIINETHFNQRIKCPPNFLYVGRSAKVESKSPRGGVAIYKNIELTLTLDVLCDSLRDCVIVGLKDTDLVIAAQYIPPSNSIYYNEIYMENLSLIYEKYKSSNLLLTGDLNSRVGSVNYSDNNLFHAPNPDTISNASGCKLMKWVEDGRKDMILLNGLKCENKRFDTDFTFYRGNVRSQNDLTFSNKINSVNSLAILDKNIYSDHCPVVVSCTIVRNIPMEFIYECSRCVFNDDHYDINRRIRQPINMGRVDLVKMINNLQSTADEILIDVDNNDNDTLAIKISDGIYKACRDSYGIKTEVVDEPLPENLNNCNSKHFKAIADMNLHAYKMLSLDPSVDISQYLNDWRKFENLAVKASNDELNTRINKSWKNVKKDGKKLWEAVDWKGVAEIKKEKPAMEADTMKYFTSIFQSPKTENHPRVEEIRVELDNYEVYIPIPDDPPTMELEIAFLKIGSGVSLDGIPPKIASFLPQSMKVVILQLIHNVFFDSYPFEWRKQILHALKKDGHTFKDPKLRGIAIAPFLCRLYDIIIDIRFCAWYKPNREQAGFRPGQGCLLQLFMLILLIKYSKANKKNLLVGFLDYEKAFDYANRYGIISDLMKKGCGKNFTKAITNMFATSEYYPKSNGSTLYAGIDSDYGVAQGRRSSGNIFSFYVSDMPQAFDDLDCDDFMEPINIAQLADDTSIYAETISNLLKKFQALFKFSKDKYQVPNVKKTVYCNFSKNPYDEPIQLDDISFIFSVDPLTGYKYLGMLFFPTDDLDEIILRNLNKRMVHISKFYSWLSVNENTPIEVKLLVLDSCVFGALLYGIECWVTSRVLRKN